MCLILLGFSRRDCTFCGCRNGMLNDLLICFNVINLVFCFIIIFRPGQIMPKMYTELLPGGQQLALIIPYLTEQMAGTYYCSARYENLPYEKTARIETYGTFPYLTILNTYIHIQYTYFVI